MTNETILEIQTRLDGLKTLVDKQCELLVILAEHINDGNINNVEEPKSFASNWQWLPYQAAKEATLLLDMQWDLDERWKLGWMPVF